MEHSKINTVEEFFRWRLPSSTLAKYGLKPLPYKSVEQENSKELAVLGWENPDTLYSFLLIYKLGLEVVNSKHFNELLKQQKLNNKRFNSNSPEFLFLCSREEEYKDLNKKLESFLKLYFNIGNLMPMWPGGNEAKGKSGLYDVPELFFNKQSYWVDCLVKKYTNTYLDEVINNDKFVLIKDYGTMTHNGLFNSLLYFKSTVLSDKVFYFDYIKHREDVIINRTQLLNDWINTANEQPEETSEDCGGDKENLESEQ